jgi:hypothetical protein
MTPVHLYFLAVFSWASIYFSSAKQVYIHKLRVHHIYTYAYAFNPKLPIQSPWNPGFTRVNAWQWRNLHAHT